MVYKKIKKSYISKMLCIFFFFSEIATIFKETNKLNEYIENIFKIKSDFFSSPSFTKFTQCLLFLTAQA